MPRACNATLLLDGQVLVAGGTAESDTPYIYLDQAYTYAPATDAWTEAGRMETARFQHRATLLADGRVLVASGNTWEYSPARPELFDPSTRTWKPTPTMVHPRINFTVVGLPDGSGLALGGGWASADFRSVEVFR